MTDVHLTTFGALLRQYRLAVGLTQQELAERSHLSPRAISDLERGLRLRPRKETVDLLSDALGLAPAQLAELMTCRRLARAASLGRLPDPDGLPRKANDRTDSGSARIPVALTSFIGREQETADVRRLLRFARLLTLTGAGGCGKTRLAFHVLSMLSEAERDTVALIHLAPLSDSTLLPQSVAAALGLREVPGQSLVQVIMDYLATVRRLLVFDNCEHLADACASLIESILQACPGVRIVATSRVALGVGGEIVWHVPPLPAPDPEQLPSGNLVAVVSRFDSVRLFVERAATQRPAFTLTEQNARAVAEICWRLDGIPLAIELAAARVRVLTAEQISGLLDDRFRLLVGYQRTVPPRHQTLHALIDWSYDLLTAGQRAVFRRLAVFAGGWTLEVVEAIHGELVDNVESMLPTNGAHANAWGGSGDSQAVPPESVLEVLARLVDSSLVEIDEHGSVARYRFLDTIRVYAMERLREDETEWHRARKKHALWYTALAERAVTELRGPDQGRWLDHLESERANVRTALTWCVEHDLTRALRAAGSLARFWLLRGHYLEGRRWLRAVLEKPITTSVENSDQVALARAVALHGAGFLAFHLGEDDAKVFLEEGHRLFRRLGHRRGTGDTLRLLARAAISDGEVDRARTLMEESLTILREIAEPQGIAGSLYYLAVLEQSVGRIERARQLVEDSLRLFRGVRDPVGIGWSLVLLGKLACSEGHYGTGAEHFEQSLTVFLELNHREGIGWALARLGLVAARLGQTGRAMDLFEDALQVFRGGMQEPPERWPIALKMGGSWALGQLGMLAMATDDDATSFARCVEGLRTYRGPAKHGSDAWVGLLLAAILAGRRANFRLTAHTLGAMSVIYPTARELCDPVERREYDACVEVARRVLGDAEFESAWSVGQAMSFNQVIDEFVGL